MAIYTAVGTHIYMDNKLLFFRTVPNLLCKETVDLLRKCKIEAIFESNTEILYDGASPAQSEFGVKMRKRNSNGRHHEIQSGGCLHLLL